MIQRADSRGSLTSRGFESRPSFSFGEFVAPEFPGLGPLCVFNENCLSTEGFVAARSQRDLEIVTYVTRGVLERRDAVGGTTRIHAGEMQVLSTGSGVRHSDCNPGSDDVHYLEIWIHSAKRGGLPLQATRAIACSNPPSVAASGDASDSALSLRQTANVYLGNLKAGETWRPQVHRAWLHVISGAVETLHAGDGCELRGADHPTLTAHSDTQILLIDLPYAWSFS